MRKQKSLVQFMIIGMVLLLPGNAIAQEKDGAEVPSTSGQGGSENIQRQVDNFPVEQITEAGMQFSRNVFQDENQNIYSTLISHTRFLSNEFDFRAEANVNHVEGDEGRARSGLFSLGFSYWPSASWSVTPFVRGGIEYFDATDAEIGVFAFDVMNEFSNNLGNDVWLILTSRIGYVGRWSLKKDNLGQSFRNEYIDTLNNIAVDMQVGDNGMIGGDNLRARVTAGVTHQIGGENDVKTVFNAITSFRTVDQKTGVDKWKVELWASFGNDDFRRGIVGVSRKF